MRTLRIRTLTTAALAFAVIVAPGARADGGSSASTEKQWMMRSQDVPAVLGTPVSYFFESSEGPGFIEVCQRRGLPTVAVPTSAPTDWVSMTLNGPRGRIGSYMLDEYAFRYRTTEKASRAFDAVVKASASCTGSVTEPILPGDPITVTSTVTTGSEPSGGVWVQSSSRYSQPIIEGGRSARRSASEGVDRELRYSVFTLAVNAVIVTTYSTDRQAVASRGQAQALRTLGNDNVERWRARP